MTYYYSASIGWIVHNFPAVEPNRTDQVTALLPCNKQSKEISTGRSCNFVTRGIITAKYGKWAYLPYCMVMLAGEERCVKSQLQTCYHIAVFEYSVCHSRVRNA